MALKIHHIFGEILGGIPCFSPLQNPLAAPNPSQVTWLSVPVPGMKAMVVRFGQPIIKQYLVGGDWNHGILNDFP